jgi:hypothetical protein
VELELEDRSFGIGRRRKARARVHPVPAVGKSDQAGRQDCGEHGAEELSYRLSAIGYHLPPDTYHLT